MVFESYSHCGLFKSAGKKTQKSIRVAGRGGGGGLKIRKTEQGEKSFLNSEEETTTTFRAKSLKMFFC